MVEKIVRKGEIACYKQFLLFSQCFQQLYIFSAQNAVLCGNGLKEPYNVVHSLFQSLAEKSTVYQTTKF